MPSQCTGPISEEAFFASKVSIAFDRNVSVSLNVASLSHSPFLPMRIIYQWLIQRRSQQARAPSFGTRQKFWKMESKEEERKVMEGRQCVGFDRASAVIDLSRVMLGNVALFKFSQNEGATPSLRLPLQHSDPFLPLPSQNPEYPTVYVVWCDL